MKVVVVASEAMGRGDTELGRQLMVKFLNSLWKHPQKPDAMIFYNSGVKLLTARGAVLEALTALSDAGVDLVACGTCASYFQITEKILVGRVSGMDEIVDLQLRADSVITV